LDISKGECVDLVNVDPDNDGNIARRPATVSELAFQPITESMFGRDYWAVGNKVYCSKALDDASDERYSLVIALDDAITMIRRTDAGLWIGSMAEIHFLAGKDPQDGGFEDIHVAPYGVIMGTGCTVKGELCPVAQMGGTCAIFASHRGVCIGDSTGRMVNLSQNKVSYDYGNYGSAAVREKNGLVHYLFQTSDLLPAYNQLPALNLELDSI
jgi:hypothetical protein